MLSYSENILHTLTGKLSINEVDNNDLKIIAEKYPYFGASQFLLAKKLYVEKKEVNEHLMQKAVLHFSDELWMHYNFSDHAKIKVVIEEEPKLLAETVLPIEVEDNVAPVTEHENDSDVENTELEEANTLEPSTGEVYSDETEKIDEADEEQNERLSNLLKEQAEALEKPVAESELNIETIPAHRIDYFESQGINLDPAAEANDKLGKQLKRFTDWLKQMKRATPNPTELENDPTGELQVQNMAEYSNEQKEIVTEAMAEVLIKQGKPNQAVQIYEKLSFINPSKSAYFAAKIQELKV